MFLVWPITYSQSSDVEETEAQQEIWDILVSSVLPLA